MRPKAHKKFPRGPQRGTQTTSRSYLGFDKHTPWKCLFSNRILTFYNIQEGYWGSLGAFYKRLEGLGGVLGLYQAVLGRLGASLGHLGRVMERLGAVQGAATYTDAMRRGCDAAKNPPRGAPGPPLFAKKRE